MLRGGVGERTLLLASLKVDLCEAYKCGRKCDTGQKMVQNILGVVCHSPAAKASRKQRRITRAAEHNTEVVVRAAVTAALTAVGIPPEEIVERGFRIAGVGGPALAAQACELCHGARHFALRCSNRRCGVCCRQTGGCPFHK